MENGGKPVPGVSPAAKQMGRRAARNILRRIAGRPSLPFRYRDYGPLATIGRKAAVANFGRLTWPFAHIYFLIGFRNRLVVMIDWVWAYWSFQRYARIIMGRDREGPLLRQELENRVEGLEALLLEQHEVGGV